MKNKSTLSLTFVALMTASAMAQTDMGSVPNADHGLEGNNVPAKTPRKKITKKGRTGSRPEKKSVAADEGATVGKPTGATSDTPSPSSEAGHEGAEKGTPAAGTSNH